MAIYKFYRVGKPPKGCSVNHGAGHEEVGVSCQTAKLLAAYLPDAWWTRLGELDVYEVTGELIGIGSDDEPLLDPATVKARRISGRAYEAAYDADGEARRLYWKDYAPVSGEPAREEDLAQPVRLAR